MAPTYSQEELDSAVREALKNHHAVEFEKKTRDVLQDILERLDEANGLKATMGQDIKDLQEYVKVQEEARKKKKDWWQDWWVRAGIVATVAYTIVYIWTAVGGLHPAG